MQVGIVILTSACHASEEAVAAYRDALAIEPRHGRAWWSLTDIGAKALEDEDIAAMENALEVRANVPEHAGNLHFALGMVRDVSGDYRRAFEHFCAGNRLRRAAQPYDADELTKTVDRWIAAFGEAGKLPSRRARSDETTPIFIIGMPRAGSPDAPAIIDEGIQDPRAGV